MSKVATITHLFPNPAQPILGIFVLHRVRAMAQYLPTEVIAPVGWLPRGMRGRPKAVPRVRSVGNLIIHHPRYISPPTLKPLESLFFLIGSFPTFVHRHNSEPFKILDTHFAYPDAPAVMVLSRLFRLPFVVTVRGEDVYGHPRFPLRKLQITQALKNAARVICLSEVTFRCCISLGVSPDKIAIIPNGVDGEIFTMIDRLHARRCLGLDPNMLLLLSAGWLIPRKGYHHVIQALPTLVQRFPNLRYIIVGGDTTTGEYKRRLLQLADSIGVREVVIFVDSVPQEQLALWMAAADLFCFPSEKEGWGNVVAEALSCGTPVIAHEVGGVRQMIVEGVNGIVLNERTPEAWISAITECLEREWDRRLIRESVSHLRWEQVGLQIANLMNEVLTNGISKH